MASNEHPNMSGNPCDWPLICDECEHEMREQDSWESPRMPGKFFCSEQCALEAEEELADEPVEGSFTGN